jgi:hypothetical protein
MQARHWLKKQKLCSINRGYIVKFTYKSLSVKKENKTMATKKAQSKAPAASSSAAPSNTDMGAIWKWVYVVSILVASVAGALGFQNNILSNVLVVIGLLVGLFYFDSSDLMNFGLRFLIVTAAASSLGILPVIGKYLTGFFTAFAAFLGPIILGMVVMYFWKKYFGHM